MPQFQIPSGTGGSVSGTTSSDLQTAFVQEFLAIAAALPSSTQTVTTPNPLQPRQGIVLHTPDLIDLPQAIDTIAGSPAIPLAQVLLDNPGATYITGMTSVSVVVATDASQANVINSNPGGALIAVTGAGQNTLNGNTGANQFITGTGGTDNVTLTGSTNILVSNGNDAVIVGGPSTVTAAAGGDDGIQLLNGATLAFINTSSSPMNSAIFGATNTVTDLVGPGSTSVTAGAGAEYFFVDTSAGNVTLNANPNGLTAVTFVKDADVGTAKVQILNLSAADVVDIHGYAGVSVVASPTVQNSALLQLSDGSQITFVGVSAAQVLAGVHVV